MKAVIWFENKKGERCEKEIELKDNFRAEIPAEWQVVEDSCYIKELDGRDAYIPAAVLGGVWTFYPQGDDMKRLVMAEIARKGKGIKKPASAANAVKGRASISPERMKEILAKARAAKKEKWNTSHSIIRLDFMDAEGNPLEIKQGKRTRSSAVVLRGLTETLEQKMEELKCIAMEQGVKQIHVALGSPLDAELPVTYTLIAKRGKFVRK